MVFPFASRYLSLISVATQPPGDSQPIVSYSITDTPLHSAVSVIAWIYVGGGAIFSCLLSLVLIMAQFPWFSKVQNSYPLTPSIDRATATKYPNNPPSPIRTLDTAWSNCPTVKSCTMCVLCPPPSCLPPPPMRNPSPVTCCCPRQPFARVAPTSCRHNINDETPGGGQDPDEACYLYEYHSPLNLSPPSSPGAVVIAVITLGAVASAAAALRLECLFGF